jgi:hypothetical protein
MGKAAATATFVEALARIFADPDNSASYLKVVERALRVAACVELPANAFVDRLTQIILNRKTPDNQRQDILFATVAAIGAAAGTKPILKTIARILSKRIYTKAFESESERRALWAIQQIGSPAATTEILSILSRVLTDGYSSMNTVETALRTVAALGTAADVPRIRRVLARLRIDHSVCACLRSFGHYRWFDRGAKERKPVALSELCRLPSSAASRSG